MDRTRVVNNNTELAAWLGEHTWFAHAETIGMTASPTVRLVLADPVRGTYEAGTTRTMQDYALTAEQVQGSSVDLTGVFASGHCCEGLELVDVEAGVAFRIDVPGRLELRCSRLMLAVLGERTELVRPWLSDRDFGATIGGVGVPSPDDWVRRFREQGAEVCWRTYGGEGEPAPSIPSDYVGWFLQSPERVATTTGGLLFLDCTQRNDRLALHWERSGQNVTDELWLVAKRVLLSFDDASISSGNCKLSTDEWRSLLETGALPERMG